MKAKLVNRDGCLALALEPENPLERFLLDSCEEEINSVVIERPDRRQDGEEHGPHHLRPILPIELPEEPWRYRSREDRLTRYERCVIEAAKNLIDHSAPLPGNLIPARVSALEAAVRDLYDDELPF